MEVITCECCNKTVFAAEYAELYSDNWLDRCCSPCQRILKKMTTTQQREYKANGAHQRLYDLEPDNDPNLQQ